MMDRTSSWREKYYGKLTGAEPDPESTIENNETQSVAFAFGLGDRS